MGASRRTTVDLDRPCGSEREVHPPLSLETEVSFTFEGSESSLAHLAQEIHSLQLMSEAAAGEFDVLENVAELLHLVPEGLQALLDVDPLLAAAALLHGRDLVHDVLGLAHPNGGGLDLLDPLDDDEQDGIKLLRSISGELSPSLDLSGERLHSARSVVDFGCKKRECSF